MYHGVYVGSTITLHMLVSATVSACSSPVSTFRSSWRVLVRMGLASHNILSTFPYNPPPESPSTSSPHVAAFRIDDGSEGSTVAADTHAGDKHDRGTKSAKLQTENSRRRYLRRTHLKRVRIHELIGCTFEAGRPIAMPSRPLPALPPFSLLRERHQKATPRPSSRRSARRYMTNRYARVTSAFHPRVRCCCGSAST
ncbi:hypothetical protein ARMGADRAFT_311869 [Armillaria gallica]|uniref:Secreted protein n=1 Tax=Armillaria gallica TaxID=47427 RepID=A0A2H3D4T8_ARMGA|nr:hypothetical protein ARMGADRAFT_311869 [Armillaria gallica]